MVYLIAWKVVSEQALRGTFSSGREKEGELATHLWNLNTCIEKVDAKCWLAEMTLVMTSLPLARVYIRARFRFALTGGNLTAQSTRSHSWNSNSRDVVASSPSFSRPAARAPLRSCSRALWKAQAYSSQICGKPHTHCTKDTLLLKPRDNTLSLKTSIEKKGGRRSYDTIKVDALILRQKSKPVFSW